MNRLLVILIFLLTGIRVFSQVADTSLWAPNGPVNTIFLKDSLLFVGGDFDQVSPVTGNFIAVDSASAVVAAPFPFVNGKVNCLMRDPASGNIYVGGLFSKVGNTDCFNLFRLTPQGNFDPSFLPNPDGEIFGFEIAWNTLYIAGRFSYFEGYARGNGAAVFLANDSLTPFDPASDGPIYAFAADYYYNTLVTGGDFQHLGGGNIAYVGKVNPNTGNYIPYGNSFWTAIPQVFGPVKTIKVLHRRIYIGGDFYTFAGFPSPGIGVLDSYNGNWLHPNNLYNTDLNGFVSDIEIINQKVYISGNFTTVDSGAYIRNRLACFDTMLRLLSWNPNVSGNVNGMALSPDSSAMYIAGNFHLLGNDTAYNAGKVLLDSAGTTVLWNPALNDEALSIIPSNLPGRVWIGGKFTGAGGELRKNLCAINTTTRAATAWNPKVNSPVTTLYADDHSLFVCGNFSTINSQPRNKIAAFDLASLTLNSFDPGVNGFVRTMIADSTDLFIGGNFTVAGGQTRNNLAKINKATGLVETWDPGCAGTVNKLLLEGNDLFVGGYFSQCGGQMRDNLAKISPVTGLADWSWLCNTDDGIYDMDIYNGQLYIGGWFHIVDGQARNYFAAVDTMNGAVLSFNPYINNYIRGFVRSGDDLFITGPFSTVTSSDLRPHLCNYDLGDGQFDAWAPSPDNFPVTMQATQNELYAGGDFVNIGYHFHPNLCLFNIAWVTGIQPEEQPAGLFLYPNPADEFISVSFEGPWNGEKMLRVFDSNGKLVTEKTWNADVQAYILNTTALSPGIYLLEIRDKNGNRSVERFIRR